MKHPFYTVVFLLLIYPITSGTNLNADIITIDFENLTYDDAVYDQYISDGIIFGDELSLPISAPGAVVSGGYYSYNALSAYSMDPGIFVLFSVPVYSVSTLVLEGPLPDPNPEPEPEPGPEPDPDPGPDPGPEPEPDEPEFDDGEPVEEQNTVYLKAFGGDNYNLLNDDSYVNALGSWQELIFVSEVPIAAIQLRGTSAFVIDNIIISTTSIPLPEPVPEPASILLLCFGLSGIAVFRNRP